eukprot:14564586-Ditylum_brightwellii.AAC.1
MDNRDTVIALEYKGGRNAVETGERQHWRERLEAGMVERIGRDHPAQVDWLIAVYPRAPVSVGKRSARMEDWADDMSSFADGLALQCGLRAAVFLMPDSWPKVTNRLALPGDGRRNWQSRECLLRNTCH